MEYIPKGDRETAARKCVPSTLCWSDLLGVPAWYLWRARCSNSWEQGTEIVQGCVFSAEDDLRLTGTGLLNTAGYNCHHYRWWKIMFFMAMVKNNVEQWVEQWCVYPFFSKRKGISYSKSSVAKWEHNENVSVRNHYKITRTTTIAKGTVADMAI